jgi:hypothetical protein
LRASAVDSLRTDTRTSDMAAWLTYANGLRSWGQLLLGAKLGALRNAGASGYRSTNDLAARVYFGSNALKAFVEGQETVASHASAQWLLNSGVELRLPSVGWLNASAGYASNPSGGRSRLISSFKFKAAVPGL